MSLLSRLTAMFSRTPPVPTRKIFLSYRRDDSNFATDRIQQGLVQAFGAGAVLRDIDNIPVGAEYQQHIAAAIQSCDVVLVVIGPQWLDAKDDQGKRRLDSPRDIVRLEIESGLRQSKRVIPLALGRTRVPSEPDLPESLRPLAWRNGVVIRSDPDFDKDMQTLIRALSEETPATNDAAVQAQLDDLSKQHIDALHAGRRLIDSGERAQGYAEWKKAIRLAEQSLEIMGMTRPQALANCRVGIGLLGVQLAAYMRDEAKLEILEEGAALAKKGIPHLEWCIGAGVEPDKCRQLVANGRQTLSYISAKIAESTKKDSPPKEQSAFGQSQNRYEIVLREIVSDPRYTQEKYMRALQPAAELKTELVKRGLVRALNKKYGWHFLDDGLGSTAETNNLMYEVILAPGYSQEKLLAELERLR